jgi:hypothetical protein
MAVLDQISVAGYGGSSAASQATTFGTKPAAGTEIFVAVSWYNTNGIPPGATVTDNGGNTYTLIPGSTGICAVSGDETVAWYSCPTPTPPGGTWTVTVSQTPTNVYPAIQAFSVNGSLDANAVVSTKVIGTSASVAVTSSVAGDLFLGASTSADTGNNAGNYACTGLTPLNFGSGGSNLPTLAAYLFTADLTTYPAAGTVTWTYTAVSGQTVAMSLLAIKPAAVTGRTGSGTGTAPAARASGTGTVPAYHGSGSGHAPAATASGTATAAAPTYHGSGTGAARAATAAGTGTRGLPTYHGAGGGTAPAAQAAGTATNLTPGYHGSGSGVAPSAIAAGTGTRGLPSYHGQGVGVAPGATAAGTGANLVPAFHGSGHGTAPAARAAGTATNTTPGAHGSGHGVAPAATANGSGTLVRPLVFAGTTGAAALVAFTVGAADRVPFTNGQGVEVP